LMPLKKITKADEKRMTKDWQELFPELSIYKNMRLLNRLGPLLVGICLEKDSGNYAYNPIFHVHNLCRGFTTVSLTLAMQIKNYHLMLSWHEKKYKELAERIRNDMQIIPFKGPVYLSTIINAYKTYIATTNIPFQIHLYEDIILISAWCGSTKEVERSLKYAQDDICNWPEYVKEKIGGFDKWFMDIKMKAQDVESLRSISEKQIEELKVANLPVREIILD